MLASPRSFVLALAVCFLPLPAKAALFQVPDDYPRIQHAIAAASDGDVIRVSAGTYSESIDFRGKAIAVLGVDGPEVTIIDGFGHSAVVLFSSGEGSGSILSGFTIRGGYEGGIFCAGTSPWIVDNRLVDNNWCGIQCHAGASPTIERNLISGNRSGHGGGILCFGPEANPVIEANEFRDNSATFGRAIYAGAGARPTILRNTFHGGPGGGPGEYAGIFVEDAPGGLLIRGNQLDFRQTALALFRCPNVRVESNTVRPGTFELSDCPNAFLIGNAFLADAPDSTCSVAASPGTMLVNNTLYGSLLAIVGGGMTAVNTIFWNGDVAPIRLEQGGTLAATYCLVRGGWPGEGNIDAHPLCIGGAIPDPHLRTGSPCVDAGTSAVPERTDVDLDGQARVLPGVPGTEARIDIGADEMAIEHAARFGEIGAADPDLSPGEVLHINFSAGDALREIRVGPGEWLDVRLSSPIAGPEVAPYVLYAFDGTPTINTVSLQPGGLGWMTFGTPLSRDSTRELDCIWNNLGFPDRLGRHHRPSEPAPSTLFRARVDNLAPGSVFTLQGFMLDDASAAIVNASVTNAIVIRVE